MKKLSIKIGQQNLWSILNKNNKRLLTLVVVLMNFYCLALAQKDTLYTRTSWRFGLAAAANFNFFDGSTQQLNADKIAPVAFHKGFGVGLFVAPMLEFQKPNSVFGFMLQAGYDGRQGKFKEVFSPCNCPRDLTAKISYLTVEPSLRVAPFKSNFYLFIGPRLAFNLSQSFKYHEGPNPDIPDQVTNPDINSDFNNMKKTIVSMQVGGGYDIQLSSLKNKTQWMLSPFVSFHPYFGQEPRTVETWTLTTVRAGMALKMGNGHLIEEPIKKVVKKDSVPEKVIVAVAKKAAIPIITFSVSAPKNSAVKRSVEEVFPIRNYVFFSKSITAIPERYKLLNKTEADNFDENQVPLNTPNDLSGRSQRQMIVYYNLLNILGDRMQKYPTTTINLVGSTEMGVAEARIMADNVKRYLVDIFGINANRITIEARDKPKIPSERNERSKEVELLHDGDRRVSIESSSPILLMAYTSGQGLSVNPTPVAANTPVDTSITIQVIGAAEAFSSYTIQVKNETGKVQYFGPYTQEKVSIPAKAILGLRTEGDFKFTLMGKTKAGKQMEKDTLIRVVALTASTKKEVTRYSVIYEFSESKTIAQYEKYLIEVVAPKIANGGTVVLEGYTDVIGDADNNQKLSLARANDVKRILEKALLKAGKKNVKFKVFAYGENPTAAQFNNTFPEERFYNRAVTIEILP